MVVSYRSYSYIGLTIRIKKDSIKKWGIEFSFPIYLLIWLVWISFKPEKKWFFKTYQPKKISEVLTPHLTVVFRPELWAHVLVAGPISPRHSSAPFGASSLSELGYSGFALIGICKFSQSVLATPRLAWPSACEAILFLSA